MRPHREQKGESPSGHLLLHVAASHLQLSSERLFFTTSNEVFGALKCFAVAFVTCLYFAPHYVGRFVFPIPLLLPLHEIELSK